MIDIQFLLFSKVKDIYNEETIYSKICTVTLHHALSEDAQNMFLIPQQMHPYIGPYTLLHISVSKSE